MTETYGDRVAGLTEDRRRLLEVLQAKRATSAPPPVQPVGPVTPRPPGGPVAASVSQGQLWFLDQLNPGQPTYNIVFAEWLTGWLDTGALRIALDMVTARHEALRTTLSVVDGQLHQVVRPPGKAEFVVDDVSKLPEEERAEAARTILMEQEVHRPFDLVAGPLFRARLIRLAPDRHAISLAMHHSMSDGWSFGLLNRELGEFYNAVASESFVDLPEPLQFGDFAAWQKRYLESGEMTASLDYWVSQLDGAATLDLPTDRPRPAVASNRGAYHKMTLSTELRDNLAAMARERGASLFMVLVAAMNAVLSKYTCADDIVLGTTASGRPQPEMEGIIGDFANMVVLRSDTSGDPTLGDLIERARDVVLGAWQHQLVPFEQVVQRLAPARDAGRNPLFQVAVQMLTGTTSGGGGMDFLGVDSSTVDLSLHRARFDLGMSLVDDSRGFSMQVEYATDLFDAARVARLADHFVGVLEIMASDVNTRLSAVDLGAREREDLIRLGTGPQAPIRTDSLHKLVLDRAAAEPDAIAVIDGPLRLTYGELAARALDLAARLSSHGVLPGDAVGSAIDRTAAEVVAIVGILQAGGVYVPVDPQSPENRLTKILTSAGAKVLLVDAADSPAAPSWNRLVVDTAAPVPPVTSVAATPAGDTAYVLFTSGSTGVPKGVVLPHGSLMAYLEWMIETGEMGASSRTLHAVASTFDLAAGEILSTLISGGTVVIAPRDVTLTPGGLSGVIAGEAVTHMFVTPSMLSLGGNGAGSLLAVFVAGEVLVGELVQRWWRPGLRFLNAYGPTEIGIACTAIECDGSTPPGPVLIGRPLPNRIVHVLDRDGHIAPVGVRGEIVVGGHIATGYLADPDLTEARFITDPSGGGEAFYRTGDLGFWTESGDLAFAGRADAQVKLRGLRIELGEVENALSLHPAVALAAATVAGEQLAAYVMPAAEATIDIGELRDTVAREIPAHMVPSRYAVVDALPMTTSGKVDRKRLPELAVAEGVSQADFVQPRDPTEQGVAAAFGAILGTERVGALDDFFRLGGHSLQAAHLLTRIAESTGVTVAMKDLYVRPTVEAVARLIRAGGASATSTLATLRADGTRPALYLVHAVSGSPYSYAPLARRLEDRPVGGFEAPGFDDDAEPLTAITEMAERYLTDLRAAQPSGPYQLGGWSFGGFVAVEMAIRLREAGEQIDALVLFDCNPPGPYDPPSEVEIAEAWVRDLAGLAGASPEPVASALADLTGDALVDRLVELVIEAGYLPAEMGPQVLRRRFRVFRANVLAMYAYQPRRYDGHMTIVGAQASGGLAEGWGVYAASHGFTEVPGNHYSMWAADNLPAIAAALETALS